MKVHAVVMAAGQGKRMQSKLPKVLHPICGRPVVEWVLEAARAVDPRPVVVVGHERERVMAALSDVDFAVQDPPQGTGHALMCAQEYLSPDSLVVALAGDMPLIRPETVQELVRQVEAGCACAMMVATVDNPDEWAYGRVVRDGQGRVSGVVEQKDATPEQRAIRDLCTSTYCFRGDVLLDCLRRLTCDNAQHEYYLTDVIRLIHEQGLPIGVAACDSQEARGINDRVQLGMAEAAMRQRLCRELQLAGATLIDPAATYVEYGVTVGRDTVVYPGNVLQAGTVIGEDCVLYPGNRLSQCRIGNGVTLQGSVILNAEVDDGATVGPYAYIRPDSHIGQNCRVGDFVEIKNATLGAGTKVSHLTYVGDADVGAGVNVGCGVVFVNYDGKRKFRSQVGDHAFIGCNTNLVAPVQVGEGAYTAAGSTITDDVPADALAVARSRQVVKAGWAARRREE